MIRPRLVHCSFNLAQNNTWQVPTLVWTEANSRIDDAELQSDPNLKYVPASIRSQWDPVKLRGDTSNEELAAVKAEAARDLELVKAMQRWASCSWPAAMGLIPM